MSRRYDNAQRLVIRKMKQSAIEQSEELLETAIEAVEALKSAKTHRDANKSRATF